MHYVQIHEKNYDKVHDIIALDDGQHKNLDNKKPVLQLSLL